ncbi:MAG: DUF262 domain-containing protein [Patescibacteria group bacterium]|nr:DUF262 domain-containing protein [Patescibacteria group bacterium]
MQKYAVNQYLISNILSDVQMGQIAIPEIQRPFVWDASKVRDLMDSLYQGYPIGYIIAWKNPDVRLKDGTISAGKKVLIDGQQRITALRAAILGEKIVNKEYKEVRIQISFNPQKEEFATLTPIIKKDPNWIADISEFLNNDDLFETVEDYCEKNPEAERRQIQKNFQQLLAIKNKQVGFIELAEGLDIETVTEIFIRINSKGVVLSQADFAMSKIASTGDFGVNLRKLIDYFCHLAREPKFFKQISENDTEFAKTSYLPKIEWLKNVNDDLYDPDYTDVIRVSFTKNFTRGKMSDLVSLLSGRNFETKEFEKEIEEKSFKNLESGVLDFINQTNFERFVMIIKSTGFIDSSMINSQNVLNFAYVVYLKLKDLGYKPGDIEKYVKKWFVMSNLTTRYSMSPESMFDQDIRNISEHGIEKYLKQIEDSELSEAFWDVGLPGELEKASLSNPYINVFFASQVYANDEGFLSNDIKVRDMIEHRGDIHHVFPKEFLKKTYSSRSDYNQIGNYVYAQQEINIRIGKKAPKQYFSELMEQIKTGKLKYGNILDEKQLLENLEKHCIPKETMQMEIDDYFDFLETRRKLMARKIERYYKSL